MKVCEEPPPDGEVFASVHDYFKSPSLSCPSPPAVVNHSLQEAVVQYVLVLS